MYEGYVLDGIACIVRSLRPALQLYAGYVCLGWGKGKRITFTRSMVWEFLWLLWGITMLRASGIVGMRVDWPAVLGVRTRFGIGLFGESLSHLLLQAALYAPYGFLTPCALKGIRWDLHEIMLLGALTSVGIGVLQVFSGQSAELVDVAMGAVGTAAGFMAYRTLRAMHLGLLRLGREENYH